METEGVIKYGYSYSIFICKLNSKKLDLRLALVIVPVVEVLDKGTNCPIQVRNAGGKKRVGKDNSLSKFLILYLLLTFFLCSKGE